LLGDEPSLVSVLFRRQSPRIGRLENIWHAGWFLLTSASVFGQNPLLHLLKVSHSPHLLPVLLETRLVDWLSFSGLLAVQDTAAEVWLPDLL